MRTYWHLSNGETAVSEPNEHGIYQRRNWAHPRLITWFAVKCCINRVRSR
ncbi:MAG: hypothetical protein KDF59_01385 [Nitrosomonas sp.]|nr:hypothetical protein [Nitrosomonas sp.]